MVAAFRVVFACVLVSILNAAGVASTSKAKVKYFRTEPTHDPVHWNVKILTKDRSRLAPGYYFFAPGVGGHEWGPKIYDIDGTLILDGDLSLTVNGVAEWRVCDWKGSTGVHVCAHDAHVGNRIFDNTYTQVGLNYSNTGDMIGTFPGTHEFNMLPGGWSFLYPVNTRRKMDLSPFGGSKNGVAKCNCFQEADVETGKPFYTYHSFDHLTPWDTYIFPDVPGRKNLTSGIAGDGASDEHAWDWMHMNAADKNAEGDYLVSGRHMDTVIKVAGPNNVHGLPVGTTIWQLGGKNSSFKIDVKFSRQHHVRYVSSGPTGDVVSLFDNAWEGWDPNPPSAKASAGMVIEANNITMKAKLLYRYDHPEGILSGSRGGFDKLPGGNAIAGWGHKVPQITEWAENGDVLFHVEYTYPWCAPPKGCGKTKKGDIPFSYRSHKSPWVAIPHWKPKLLAYSRTCNPKESALVAYVSWNGATEVKKWQFYTGPTLNGPWADAGIFEKDGFETQAVLPKTSLFQPFARADAIDVNGKVIGTVDSTTFVPDHTLVSHCSHFSCADQYKYPKKHSKAHICATSHSAASAASESEYTSHASNDGTGFDHPILWSLPAAFVMLWVGSISIEVARSMYRWYANNAAGAYDSSDDPEKEGRFDGDFYHDNDGKDCAVRQSRISSDDTTDKDKLLRDSA